MTYGEILGVATFSEWPHFRGKRSIKIFLSTYISEVVGVVLNTRALLTELDNHFFKSDAT